MRHAENDFLHAERAAALNDLFEAGNNGFSAVETKAFGAGVFDVEKFLETFGLNQLVENRQSTLLGENDFFFRTFDARLKPGFLRRIGDVHEFEADGAAVGAAQNRDHFEDGGVLQAEHAIDEDLAIVICVGKAIGCGIKLAVILALFETQRIEIGVQMTAHTIGADHHQRAHGVTRRASHILGRCGVGRGDGRCRRCVAGQRLCPVVACRRRPVMTRPARSEAGRRYAHIGEELSPLWADAGGIGGVGREQSFNIGGVCALKEGGVEEGLILRRPGSCRSCAAIGFQTRHRTASFGRRVGSEAGHSPGPASAPPSIRRRFLCFLI